jgi:hypothetical protein
MGIKRVSPTCDLDQINVAYRESLLGGAYSASWMNLDELSIWCWFIQGALKKVTIPV